MCYIDYVCIIAIDPKAPMNVSVYSPGPTSLMATWDHPLPQDRNGIITDYLISIKITDDSEDMFLINSNSNETSYTIKGLRESTEYIVSIAAVTSVGIGVESNDVIHKTLNDSKYKRSQSCLYTYAYVYYHLSNSLIEIAFLVFKIPEYIVCVSILHILLLMKTFMVETFIVADAHMKSTDLMY